MIPDTKTRDTLLQDIAHINSRIREPEKFKLYDLASQLHTGATIVEVGSCYGASSACLGLGSRDECRLYLFDIFVHHPAGPASKELLERNLNQVGLERYGIIEEDTMKISPWGGPPIDLLFIDGAHDFGHVWNDLTKFGPSAIKIVCHDYMTIPSVKQAVDYFARTTDFKIVETYETLAILEKAK